MINVDVKSTRNNMKGCIHPMINVDVMSTRNHKKHPMINVDVMSTRNHKKGYINYTPYD